MIIRDKPSAFKLFFVLKGSVVPAIAPQILFSALVGLFVYFTYTHFPDWLPILTVTPFILLGVTLSIFLGFRNRASYERWWEARNLEERLTSLSTILAACERIHNTPLPFAYNLLLHRTAYIYCFSLPFGLVTSLGIMTPFVTAIIAYTFFGLDALGEELEDPFGTSAHDLALTTMSYNIEINLLETLHEENLPYPIKPDGYYHA